MTSKEVVRAMSESNEPLRHLLDLTARILDKEVSEGAKPDLELDTEWEKKIHGID